VAGATSIRNAAVHSLFASMSDVMKPQILSEREVLGDDAGDALPRASRKLARTASQWTLLITALTVCVLVLLRMMIGPDIAPQSYPFYFCLIVVCAVGVLTSWQKRSAVRQFHRSHALNR